MRGPDRVEDGVVDIADLRGFVTTRKPARQIPARTNSAIFRDGV